MNRDDYPVMLSVDPHVMEILDLSRSKAYEFVHREDLAVKINGHSLRVPRWALFQWIEEEVGVRQENVTTKRGDLNELTRLD